MDKTSKYTIDGISLYSINNKNELRVVRAIQALIDASPELKLDSGNIQDIYALALNSIPPRYTQTGTIVLREPIRQDEIAKIVSDACDFILMHPKE